MNEGEYKMANSFVRIIAPVGTRNGKNVMPNQPSDLATVTELFDRIPFSKGGTQEIGGMWATERMLLIAEVTAEIVRFQTVNSRTVVDGVIDPGGGTLKLMNQLATDPPAPRLLTQMPGIPDWEDWGHKMLPLLNFDKVAEVVWELTFGGGELSPMISRAYACDKSLGTPHIGIGWSSSVTRPSAYLLYFHHSIGQEAAAYASSEVRFKKGIGDYLIGRMKGLDQISRSGKNVCLVIPEPTFAGQGVFDSNEQLITQVLREIDADFTGGELRDLPPLLVASYSDGLERLNKFMTSCPKLRQQVRGVYDFDGMLVSRLSNISLSQWSQGGTKVFRYVGNSSPGFLPKESKMAYLNRCVNRSPKLIPLPKERWINHPHYSEFKANPNWANSWWMHFYIPSCMLYHGLANTDGI
jgi:hypothetical protein